MRSDLSRSVRNKKRYKIRVFAENNAGMLKTAVVIMMVVAAFLFFSMNGENDEIVLRETGSLSYVSSENTASDQHDMKENTNSGEEVEILYVDIAGEVNSPGVYQMTPGSRVFEVIEKAGGLTENADVARLNRAGIVSDGEKITVPSVKDSLQEAQGSAVGSPDDGLVNINTANEEELTKLTGIGPSTARKIIEYREQHGAFVKTEDIMNISGIGNKTYENIKDFIVVW